jgi:hypothetical protein
MSFLRDHRFGDDVDADAADATPTLAPGKRPLTGGLPRTTRDLVGRWAGPKAPAEEPAAAFAAATSSGGGAVPYAEAMASYFGSDFGDVVAYTGKSDELAAMDAEAVTDGLAIAFASTEPSPALVAHELTHVVQQRRAGGAMLAASGATSDPSDDAEREADAVAAHVARHGPVGPAPRIAASPRAHLSRQRADASPAPPTDAGVAPEPATSGPTIELEPYVFSTDAAQVRWQLERAVASLGAPALDLIVGGLRGLVHYTGRFDPAPLPGGGDAEHQRGLDRHRDELAILAVVEREARTFRGEVTRFTEAFEAQALAGARELLTESEQRVDGEMARYGVEPGPQGRFVFSNDAEHVENRAQMQHAAGEIVASDAALRRMRQRREDVIRADPAMRPDISCGGHHAPLRDVLADPGVVESLETRQQRDDLVHALDAAIAAGERQHGQRIARAERDFPVIAQYTSGEEVDLDGLRDLARAPSAQSIGGDALGKLSSIRRVRADLADPETLRIWELPTIVQLTVRAQGIEPDTWQHGQIEWEAQWRRTEEEARERALAVIAISLAIVSGVGVFALGAASTVVLAAEGIALGLDLYLLTESVQAFEQAHALADTDYDHARLLSAEEPSLFWLAVDLLGTLAGAASARQAFGDFVTARRQFLAARTVADSRAQLDALRHRVRAAQLDGDKARRLEAQLVDEHPDPSIRAALQSSSAGAAAGDVSAAGGDVIGAVTRELGLPAELSAELGHAVRVVYSRNLFVVRLEKVVVGTGASVADVLAHREVVRLMRRYEGVTGRLRELSETLVLSLEGQAGRLNPFPPRSMAYNSWHELRKIPELIEARLDRLERGVGLTPAGADEIRDDLRFFEAELVHHQDVVERMVLERGDDFIARGARSNEPAFRQNYPRSFELDGRRYTVGEDDSLHYYAEAGDGTGRFVLRPYADVDAPHVRVEGTPPNLRFSRATDGPVAEAAERLASWPAETRAAFEALVVRARDQYRGAQVVPLAGIARTDIRLGELMSDDVRREIIQILVDAMPSNPARRADARRMVQAMADHEIVLVRGTGQLRRFRYRARFVVANGVVNGEIHHLVPLYLGGGHQLDNLIPLDSAAHARLHRLLDDLHIEDAVLDPDDAARFRSLNFQPAAGILHNDGTVQLEALSAAASAP